MTRPVVYATTYRFRSDPATSRLLDECVRHAASGEEGCQPNMSSVIREAIAMYHKYHVRGYSFINPNDPNYN